MKGSICFHICETLHVKRTSLDFLSVLYTNCCLIPQLQSVMLVSTFFNVYVMQLFILKKRIFDGTRPSEIVLQPVFGA